MRIRLSELRLRTKQTWEVIPFSPSVTFLHGPVSTGKSTVARLVDYCLGGDLEWTPALRSEFVSAELAAELGKFSVLFERVAHETGSVRVTWTDQDEEEGSVSAPLDAGSEPVVGEEVYNLSDLIFKLCDVEPIKVRRSKHDPDSPLVRLSFRDVMWYCYLQQDLLDSSFFRMEDPFRRLKSRDVMRFVTGLHSARLNELDTKLSKAIDEQRSKREAVKQIRKFMAQFEMGNEIELSAQVGQAKIALEEAEACRRRLETSHAADTHSTDPLRGQLREMSNRLDELSMALDDLSQRIEQQESLRAELISTKIKSHRIEGAGSVLSGVEFQQCPQCGAEVASSRESQRCSLCKCDSSADTSAMTVELETLRRDLNERIDDLADSIRRHKRSKRRQEKLIEEARARKAALDRELAHELARYDSAYVSKIRQADRESARLEERILSLERLRRMPQAVNDLERQAGELQGRIDNLKSALEAERGRLTIADQNIAQIASTFYSVLRTVKFPGVFKSDEVKLDPRNWMPYVSHGDQEWTFADAGSGGKKTLFNVCYALAVHQVAAERDRPLPSFLIIDSPTKNISQDENEELVRALYNEIYGLAEQFADRLQFVLIDSEYFPPVDREIVVGHRRMATGDGYDSPLIPYYEGP